MNPENKIYTFDGLDATGKSTILNIFKKENIKVINSPPECIKSYRQSFDQGDLESRFFYYLLGNIWIDKNILQPSLNSDEEEIILIDRSVLSTLAAHELRGISEESLEVGFNIAKTFVKPRTSFIIHVETEKRLQRLFKRSNIDEIDRQNINFENTMEPTYRKWASRLGWEVLFFDNSDFTPEEAHQKLSELLSK